MLKLLNVKALTQQMTCKLICFQHRQHGPAPVLHSLLFLSLQIQLGLCCFSLHSSNRSRETPLHMSCQCLFLPRQEIRECVCSRRTQQHSHGNASLLSFIRCLCSIMRLYSSLLPWASAPINTSIPTSFSPYNFLPPFLLADYSDIMSFLSFS